MTLSVILASDRTVDLLSPHEEAILVALLQYIEHRTDQAKEILINALALQIGVSYQIGGSVAAKEIGTKGPLGMEGLDSVIQQIGSHLDSTFGSDSNVISGVIDEGVRKGYSYDRVKAGLVDKLKAGWGKALTFNNVGRTRDAIHVNPDGTMKRIKVTIEKPITITTDTYAETLSRTSMKQAYVAGHWSRYEDAGYPGWVYMSVADERTRPRHLALHGRTFLFGTPEEQMARDVMKEYRCRCRPKAWFGDPKRDVPVATYAVQRADWSRQTFDEWKLDKNMPLLVQEAPQTRNDLHALAPQLKTRMDTNDWKILAHQMGLTQDELTKDTIQTIEDNFFFRTLKTGEKENTAVHIYQKHVLNDALKSGKQPFTVADVLKAKDEGIIYKHLDAGGEKLKVLWKSPDGRLLNVIMSNRYPGKVVTAHRIPQSDWDKIVKEGEEIAR